MPSLATDKEPTKPHVPELDVAAPPPRSFLVQGIARDGKDGGLAFRVATNGERQLSMMYVAADGTPIFISNGQQTLTYDLVNSRVVLLPLSHGTITMDLNEARANEAMKFMFEVRGNPKIGDISGSVFRFDRVVALHRFQEAGADGKSVRFVYETPFGSTMAIHQDPTDLSWFRFTTANKGEPFYILVVEATHIERKVPEAFFAFPDLKALAENAWLQELKGEAAKEYLFQLSQPKAWLPKFGLCSTEMRVSAAKQLPDLDWAALAIRDKKLSSEYRQALSKAGYQCLPYGKGVGESGTQ